MAIPAEPARRGSRFTALYVALWAVLALGALVYLVAMALKPDLASRLAGVTQDASETQADATRTSAEIEDLKQSLASVRTDIGTLKDQLSRQDERSTSALRADVAELSNALAQREERERSLSARLAAVEGWQATYERTMHTASAGSSAPQMVNGTVTGSVHDTARRAAQANAKGDAAAAHRTTTAAAAPATKTATPTPAATKAAAPAGPVALQLASSTSLDELRLSWLRISSTNASVLPKLEPRYLQAKSGTATSYRLILGPFADAEEGARVCTQMKAKKLGCSVTAFGAGGQPL